MSASVLQLPRASVAPASQVEAQVVGAALDMGLAATDFEALGLAPEDFTVELHRKAWAIARKRAEHRELVTAETVGAAGFRGKWFDAGALEQLCVLANSNTLTRVALTSVAEDLRQLVRANTLASNLETYVRELRGGAVSLRTMAQRLDAQADALNRDTAPDEDASGDVVELLHDWDTAEREGKSRLLPTRINVLDEEIGGLPPGLTVFGASPGVGKTAVLDSMIRAQLEADPDLHLGFFGLEDGTSHIARRWMARDTGMLLREVGWKKRTDEQRAATEAAAERFFPLLRRLHVFRHDTITAAELVTRAIQMRLKHGVAAIYVDNLTEVDVSGRGSHDKEYQAVAELGRRLRNFGLREKVPIGLIAHTTGGVKAGAIPEPEDLAGGQALARRMRLFFALWSKGDAIRCTTGKANELGPKGVTVEFARFATAGLIDPTNGAKVNMHAERAAERDAKAEDRYEFNERMKAKARERTAAEKAKADAEKMRPVEPPPQSELPLVPHDAE